MDKRTTENYLDSFDKEIKKEYANNLLAFKEDRQVTQKSKLIII